MGERSENCVRNTELLKDGPLLIIPQEMGRRKERYRTLSSHSAANLPNNGARRQTGPVYYSEQHSHIIPSRIRANLLQASLCTVQRSTALWRLQRARRQPRLQRKARPGRTTRFRAVTRGARR